MDPEKATSEPEIVCGNALIRACLPLAVRLLWRFRPKLAPRVCRITPWHYLKCGPQARLAEAQAMIMISQRTSVPVPRVIAAFRNKKGVVYMLMTKCPGRTIAGPGLTPEGLTALLKELGQYVRQIRALPPPRPGVVGTCVYTPMNDFRAMSGPHGPFDSVDAFHAAIRDNATIPTGHEVFDEVITLQSARSYDVKFTHGDLGLHNIIYDKGKITGIIDWEFSGWLPEYWEYVNTHDAAWYADQVRAQLDDFLDPYPKELYMETERRRLLVGP